MHFILLPMIPVVLALALPWVLAHACRQGQQKAQELLGDPDLF